MLVSLLSHISYHGQRPWACTWRRIPCSDWLLKRERWAYLPVRDCPLWSRARNKVARGRLIRFLIFGKWRRWSRKSRQKTVQLNQRNINDSCGFLVLQTQWLSFQALEINKSFLILNKPKLFFLIVNTLLTKLVRSRRLDNGLVLFPVFMDLDFVSIHCNGKKKIRRLSSHLDLTLGQ